MFSTKTKECLAGWKTKDKNRYIFGLIDSWYKCFGDFRFQCIEGGFMGGAAPAIEWYFYDFYTKFQVFVDHKIFAGIDENIMPFVIADNTRRVVILDAVNVYPAKNNNTCIWQFFFSFFVYAGRLAAQIALHKSTPRNKRKKEKKEKPAIWDQWFYFEVLFANSAHPDIITLQNVCSQFASVVYGEDLPFDSLDAFKDATDFPFWVFWIRLQL